MTNKNMWSELAISPLPGMITPTQVDVSRRGAMQTGQTLRKQAEKIFRDKAASPPENLETLSIGEIRHAFHELQLHQIELEMQNEALHRIQDELEVAMSRYFDLYDLAPVGYCTISDTGLILEANLTAASMLGVPKEGLIRHPLSRFILKEDQDNYYLFRKKLLDASSARQQGSNLARSDQAGVLHDCDLRMVANDGGKIWVNLQVIVAEDAGYAPVYQMVLIDISDRKQAEALRIKLEDKLRQLQKVESLERMAGGIAHHFNNKLHVVMGNLELAKEGQKRGKTTTPNLTAAMLAADQAVEVSRMLLIYLGQVTGKQEPLDLSEVCRHTLSTLRAGVPKAVKIETVLPSPGPPVTVNAKQIQQILGNLVTNAWESADDAEQCTIHLSAGTVSPTDIPTSHRFPIQWQPCRDSYACLEVRDNGCGITKEALEEIFSPFFSTKFTGRGLGLPMVLGLVQVHGGVVTVESKFGRGSIFRVFLPISEEIVPHVAIIADKSAEIKQTATVLLVDDDGFIVDITSRMLSMLGFTVLSASDGLEALELFRQHRADIQLVLSDVSMPRMNGLETLNALRKIAPDIPVILASGYSEDKVMDGTHPEQPQAYLEKPYGYNDLKDAIGLALAE